MNELNDGYYSVNDMYGEKFYQVPKVLFTSPLYKDSLKPLEKLAFGMLKDRFSLSVKNGWYDDQGRIYFIFTIEKLMEILDCSNKTASNIKKNLIKVGLLEVKKRGLGKADLLYLKKPVVTINDIYEIDKQEKSEVEIVETLEAVETCKNYTSRDEKITRLEMKKLHANDTDINNTNINNTNIKESNNTSNLIDDDKELQKNEISTGDNAALSEYEINLIIHNLRESTKDEFPENLFNEVIQKVMDMYNQGKIENNFRGYLATSLFDRMKKFGIQTMQDDTRKQMLIHIANAKSEIKVQQKEVSKTLPFYNWLERKKG